MASVTTRVYLDVQPRGTKPFSLWVMNVIALPDRDRLAQYASDFLVTELPRHTSFGLAGGSTPKATYTLLGDAPVDWSRLALWVSDERWVPINHEDRNGRMAKDALGPKAAARMEVPLYGELLEPARAAEDYERVLDRVTPDGPGLVLLGMGDDGHTASLFPGTAALKASGRTYVENHVPGKGWRLTATIDYLGTADRLVFLIAGEGKAGVLRRILDDHEDLPTRTVITSGPDVTLLVDEAAAAELEHTAISRP